MNSIEIIFGKTSFTNTSSSWLVAKIDPPFFRIALNKLFKRQGQPTIFPGSAHPEINGKVIRELHYVPDGTIVLLQAQHTAKGVRLRDGSLFIRIRKSGSQLRIFAKTIPAQGLALNENLLMFFGNGDILSVEDLKGMGVIPPPQYVRGFCNQEEIRQCFQFDEQKLSTTTDKPKNKVVEVSETEKVTITLPAPPRRKLKFDD